MDGGRMISGSDIMALLDNPNHPIWISPTFHETMSFDCQEEQQQHMLQQQQQQQQQLGQHEQHMGLKRGPEMESLLRGNNVVEEHDLEMMGSSYMSMLEKKRRLTPEQVEYLEMKFEKDSKLEPDKKVELAKELGLEPRQVSVWFQNKRARYKSKQLERDYSNLKSRYDNLRADYELIKKEKLGLQNQIEMLNMKLRQMELGQSILDSDAPIINTLPSKPHPKGRPKLDPRKSPKVPPPSMTKQTEDAFSGKSDVLDSESPNSIEVNRYLEGPVDSTHLLRPSGNDKELMMNVLSPTPTSKNISKVDEHPYYWAWFS